MKIAFTGSHGTGKTTSVAKKFYDMKLHNPENSITILTENAKNSPFKINKETSFESQLWIFSNQMQSELFFQANYDILICDRTIVDSIAYTMTAGLNDLANSMMNLAKDYICTYEYIIFKTIKNNDFLMKDGIRDHNDLQFRQDVENHLLNLYKILQKDKKINFEVI